MRRTIFTALLLLTLHAQAQVPHWKIHPNYENVEMIGNGLYIVSNNNKYGILNAKEKEILPIKYDKIGTFKSHYAVLFEDDNLVAYISDEGRLTDISNKYFKAVGQPVFNDGYLMVFNSSGFYYIHAEDDQIIGPFSGGTPFSEGYASVRIPKKRSHVLDGDNSPQLISAKTGQEAVLNLGDFDSGDIDFISSVSNGKLVVVLKKRFYEYDVNKETLTPMSIDGNLADKRSRVIAKERPVNITTAGTGYTVQSNQGTLCFDSRMRLTSINYVGQFDKKIPVPEEDRTVKETYIKSVGFSGTDLLGLSYNGKTILSPQFEEITVAWENEAVAKQNGKFGVVEIDPDKHVQYMMNDGLPIGFEHKTAKTSVKAVCTPNMDPKIMTLTSDDCIISPETRQESKNIETVALSYQCILKIPPKIGLEKRPATTKFSLNYDGLKLSPADITFDAWHVVNYSAEIVNHGPDADAYKVELLIKNISSDNANYFHQVTVSAENSVTSTIIKNSEENYTALFYDWKNDDLRFSVNITEDGCPTLHKFLTVPGKNSAKASTNDDASSRPAQKVKRKVKTTPKKKEQINYIPE